MSSAHFDPAVGGDGSTVSDDANPTTGLARGGHWTRFVPALAQIVAVAQWVLAKANQVSTWATNAAASATAAASSASSAASSANSALATLDAFDDRYLGAKSSAPTVDNDGNALIVGALYWRTAAPIGMYAWDGSAWLSLGTAPTSAGAVGFTPTGNIAASNVQSAIAELDSEKQPNLGFTPYNATNPAGYISGINGGMVVGALGYTPTNKAGDTGVGATGYSGLVTAGAGVDVTGGVLRLRTGGPGIRIDAEDGSHKWTIAQSGAASNNDLIIYDQARGVIALTINATTGVVTVPAAMVVSSSVTGSTAYASNWFRSTGNTGWYSEDWAGGICMTDADYVRVTNGKSLFAQTTLRLGDDRSGSNRTITTQVGATVLGLLHTASNAGLYDYSNGWWRYYTDAFGNLTTRGDILAGGSVSANGNVSASGAVSGAFGSCGTNATGNKTISSSPPSGGSHGDIWYQV